MEDCGLVFTDDSVYIIERDGELEGYTTSLEMARECALSLGNKVVRDMEKREDKRCFVEFSRGGRTLKVYSEERMLFSTYDKERSRIEIISLQSILPDVEDDDDNVSTTTAENEHDGDDDEEMNDDDEEEKVTEDKVVTASVNDVKE